MISSSSNGSRFAEVIVAALLITSIWDPARGLLAIAVLAPFQSLLPFLPLQPLVLAFLVGWLARQPASLGPRVPAVSAGAAWLLSGFVVASVLMARAITIPAIAVLEGMGVAIAVVELFRRRPVLGVQLPMALCASMTIVALFALIGRIGVPSLGYFAMMLCVAGGMTLRDQGSARVLWVVVVLAMLGGCVKFFLQPAAARFDMADTPWVGTALILLFAAGALVQAYHGIVASSGDGRLIGCIAGVIAFMVTQAANPPRADVAVVFYLVLGLMTALAGSNVLRATRCLRTS